ncbi:Regulator of Vps4 activity in the MVB pathway protein [Euphorbia peplus]|nr:Regulator of Vps4 activity in the MVB pathway protein [Euphorbia peplus]
MLDGLLKSKYHTKCKSLLRMIKTRLEVLKKKKSSVVKFLKNDIADLLRNGLDVNAYGRVQGLLVEQKMITCYDFMDQFCDCVSNNVNAMAKQRECPEECKEAIQSLMYAAARISEIPELRDLRKVFTERYGSLEPYTNKQFIESFKPVSATKEMKLQTLDQIAAEFNINWNSKSLANELATHEDEKQGHSSFKSQDEGKKGSRRNTTKNEIEDGYNLPRSSSEDEMISSRRTDSSDLASSSSLGNSSEDEIEPKKPLSYISNPPPYVKPASPEPLKDSNFEEEARAKPRSVRRKPVENVNTGSVDQRPLKPPPGRERSMDNKDQEAAKILSWRSSNEGFGIRKSKSDEMPERVVDEEAEKVMKKHNRTVSEQPQFKHVHPNLPDNFDDLAARLAALTGR